MLIGASRKSFIGRLTGIEEPRQRDPASIWLAVEAARRGAAIVRVHDVAGTRQALAVSRGNAIKLQSMSRHLFGTDGVRGRANSNP